MLLYSRLVILEIILASNTVSRELMSVDKRNWCKCFELKWVQLIICETRESQWSVEFMQSRTAHKSSMFALGPSKVSFTATRPAGRSGRLHGSSCWAQRVVQIEYSVLFEASERQSLRCKLRFSQSQNCSLTFHTHENVSRSKTKSINYWHLLPCIVSFILNTNKNLLFISYTPRSTL